MKGRPKKYLETIEKQENLGLDTTHTMLVQLCQRHGKVDEGMYCNGVKYQEVVLLSGLRKLVLLYDKNPLLGILNLKCTKQQ